VTYRVRRDRLVLGVLDPTREAALTLATCYPCNFLGNAPMRFIVRGELVSERPRS
jgi:sortase (surface protein transpeptidase)